MTTETLDPEELTDEYMNDGFEYAASERDLEQQDAYERLLDTTEIGPKGFRENPIMVACMDERARPADGRPVIGIAGSGVLMSDAQRRVALDKMEAAGIDLRDLIVTDHENCGACELYCQDHPEVTPDEAAEESAVRLAAMSDTVKPIESIGWSEQADLSARGHEGSHHARVIYIDFTGRFNPVAAELPDGFLISAAYSPDNGYLQTEVKIAQEIAIGGHGRGPDYFKENGPLVLAVIAEDAAAAAAALGESVDHRAEVTRTLFIKPNLR